MLVVLPVLILFVEYMHLLIMGVEFMTVKLGPNQPYCTKKVARRAQEEIGNLKGKNGR
jgi:hypothetical protein